MNEVVINSNEGLTVIPHNWIPEALDEILGDECSGGVVVGQSIVVCEDDLADLVRRVIAEN